MRCLLDHHEDGWGGQGSSVEQTMHFDEHCCSSSRESVCCAVDSLCALSLVSAEVWWIDLAASAIIFKVFGGGLNQGKVVVDDVGDTDGGCAGVVGGDVAARGGDDDGCGGVIVGCRLHDGIGSGVECRLRSC